jgi:hypothetical protein
MSEYDYGNDQHGDWEDNDEGFTHDPTTIEAVFTDGTSIAVTDFDNDGHADTVSYDEDGDGYYDGGVIDTNHDGVLDTPFQFEYAGEEQGADHRVEYGGEREYAGGEREYAGGEREGGEAHGTLRG